MTIRTVVDSLRDQNSQHEFAAAAVGEGAVYVGVDALGRPALFVPSDDRARGLDLRSAQVSFHRGERRSLTTPTAGAITGRFDRLQCETTDLPAVDTFIVLLEAFITNTALDHSGQWTTAVQAFFQSLVRLFSVEPARDLTREQQGLWGELFVMRTTNGYPFWAHSWHTEPDRRFDFSSANLRVEVKTVLEGPRIHHFSHRQIYSQSGETIVIASCLVGHDDVGLSLRTLIEEYRADVTRIVDVLKLERAVRRAGMDDNSLDGPRFDQAAARGSLAWFESDEVPHFRVPEPPGVTDTRYRVDLSTAPALDRAVLNTLLRDLSLE